VAAASTTFQWDPLTVETVIAAGIGAVAIIGVVAIRVRSREERARKAFQALMNSGITSMDVPQQNYVESSWLRELLSARDRVRFNKWCFLTFRFVAVAGALVLPALASQSLGGTPPFAVSVATFSVSVAVAISAGAIQVFRFGNEWSLDTEYANALEAEGWAYFQKVGHYRESDDPSDAFQAFFKRIEDLRRFRGDRRSADIRSMASEASKEPAPATEQSSHGLPHNTVGIKAPN
jgi:uncharacterized protein DUF4231